MAIVNPFDLLGDDDTDPTQLTELHEEIIKKTNDEKKKAREEQARAKAIAEKKAARNLKQNRANVDKSGKETMNGSAEKRDNGRGYSRNGQNNRENLSGSSYGNNRNFNGYSGGYNNVVEAGVNNNSTGRSYNGSYRGDQRGGYRNGESGGSYERVPHRQFVRQNNYYNGNAGGNYEKTSQRQVETQSDNLEDGFERPSRRHVIRQNMSITGSDKFLESSTDHGTTKTVVDAVFTQEPLVIAKTENNTLIAENKVKEADLPASDANNDKKEKKEDELPTSDANNEQKANVADEEENKEMTLNEYEKILEEKRKQKPSLALRATEERKVQLDKEFQSMQQLSLKNQKDASLPDEKMKKLSGRTTDSHGSVKGEKQKEDAKREELLKNLRNVLKQQRYYRPRPQRREGYGGQVSSDTAQSNGNQGPAGQTSLDTAPSNGHQCPQSVEGYVAPISSDTVQSNGNQGNGNRSQSGRAQSNGNQGYGNRPQQFRRGPKPQKEVSPPVLESPAEFPPLKIAKD